MFLFIFQHQSEIFYITWLQKYDTGYLERGVAAWFPLPGLKKGFWVDCKPMGGLQSNLQFHQGI